LKAEVKLALSEDEIKAEEALLGELAKFLKEEAVAFIAKELRSGEGVPTDSESMKQLFHSHGVNMRYLGELYKKLSEAPADEKD
jgi:hypothetical protein